MSGFRDHERLDRLIRDRNPPQMFKIMSGGDTLHVPYRTAAPAITDLFGGQVQVYFGIIPSSIGYIREGKLRALAVATATRFGGVAGHSDRGRFCAGI